MNHSQLTPAPKPDKPENHIVQPIVSVPPKPKKARTRNPIKWIREFWSSASKNKKIIIVAIAAGLLVGTASGLYFLLKPAPPPPAPAIVEPEPEPEPEPTTVASNLTGMQVEPELAELPVTAVVIENSPDARPQSGLQDAGVVFEAMVEGSITRFLALYQEQKPEHIGPIRSVRRNHVDWVLGFDAAIAHVGGSPYALSRIRNENVKDLDQFANPEAYRRVNTRFAPHNMYSDRNSLLKVHDKRGYNSSSYTGFARKDAEPSDSPDAKEVEVRISSPLYNVRFVYDGKTNTYKRFMGGTPHVDERTNKQISSDVVVVMVANHSRDGIYSVYRSIGSGTAYIFQDGTLTKGTWEKRNKKENIRFGDENGSPLGLNPGQTWITLATNENQISVKP